MTTSQLRGVLTDGVIVTQDPTNKETVVFHGAGGREVGRCAIGDCVVAKSARGSDDVFLFTSGGVVRRVARDGSERWRFRGKQDLAASGWEFFPSELIELPDGAVVLCDINAAVYLDPKGSVRKFCRWPNWAMRERPRLVNDRYLVWASGDGSFAVGDVRKW